MNPTIKYRNNDLAAHAVYEYIKGIPSLRRHLTLRPFNYIAPDFTPWWLVPSTDWPAYHHSKLCFEQWSSDALLNGFYVEKGLGDQLAGMVKSSLIMEGDWYWFELLEKTQAGHLDEPLRVVLERSELPIVVDLNLYEFNNVPDLDTGKKMPDDRLCFVIRDVALPFERSVEATGLLSQLNDASDLRDLATLITHLEEMSWYWINFRVGIQLRYKRDDPGDWGAADMWRNALEPWIPWIW